MPLGSLLGRLYAFFALLALPAFFFPGCGVKTHPYSEASSLPAPVRDLTPTLAQGGQLWLTWLSPTLNVAGRPLTTLDHFEIWGASHEKKGYCQGCPSSYEKLAEVFLIPPPPGVTVSEGPYRWSTTIKPDRAYRFRVAGFSRRGAVNEGGWREVEVFGQVEPKGAPRLSVKIDDLAVILSWTKPSPGQIAEIQKKAPDKDWAAVPGLNGQTGSYTDLDVAYGRNYSYRARFLAGEAQSLAPGPFSPEMAAKVEDLAPPRPVGYLDAASAEGGVSLRWESLAPEEKLAG
jgi:hypothetical protein